uniref:DNA-directed RNA polymerase n=1 Tax=Physcomitrium patens TaxID=3218 RepID=A0A2K1JYM4_PHYPA|nr:hypothetical protein PHYPA_013745 [Physcomitrium patens]
MASQLKTISFSFYSTEEIIQISSTQISNKDDIGSPALGTRALVYCSVCPDPKRCPGHIGFIQLKEPIFNPLCLKEIIKVVEMICPRCRSFNSIGRIKGKKQGTFRRYILGKRNKHCARAVITPDPNIDVDEVGIPLSFYSNLKVQKDGDYVLLNRQFSLQRMSLMAFRARMMLDSCTIGINPFVCPVFNADFDGDEMNVFYTSSYPSKAECDVLLAVDKCILSPQNSMPTVYAIQDTITGAFMMYKMNKLLRRSTLHDCMMVSHVHLDITNVHTSRDLILMLIKLISNESNLVIKSLTSSTIKNIIKSIFISKCGRDALMFLGSLQRIVDRWLLEEGLSIGYDDCVNKVSPIAINNVDIDDKNVDVVLNNIKNINQRLVVESVDKNNPLFTMIESGSKGSFVNLGQISSLVGQQ